MSLQKLSQDLQKLSNKCVQVKFKSAIDVVVFISNFEFIETDNYICFGELYSEDFQYEIPKSKIKEITPDSNLNDEFGAIYQSCIKLESGEFIQYIIISHEE
jgi:hypothetical protein